MEFPLVKDLSRSFAAQLLLLLKTEKLLLLITADFFPLNPAAGRKNITAGQLKR